MDEMGFDYIDLLGGAVFDVCVRFLREDPWDRMRQAARLVTENAAQRLDARTKSVHLRDVPGRCGRSWPCGVLPRQE